MKRIVYILSVCLLIVSTGCLKGNDDSCEDQTPASEAATIQAYAATQSITAVSHSSGLYYQVISPGSGPTPSATSKIYVTYTGKLLDGSIFDSGTTPAGGWVLSGLIYGWQVGLPLIQKGGSIKLIVPSALAYGCTGKGIIPANAILFFDVQLTDVQ